MAKVLVDKSLCIGCGACEALCPDIFKVVDGKSKVLKASVPDNKSVKCAKQAAASCPVSAISVQ